LVGISPSRYPAEMVAARWSGKTSTSKRAKVARDEVGVGDAAVGNAELLEHPAGPAFVVGGDKALVNADPRGMESAGGRGATNGAGGSSGTSAGASMATASTPRSSGSVVRGDIVRGMARVAGIALALEQSLGVGAIWLLHADDVASRVVLLPTGLERLVRGLLRPAELKRLDQLAAAAGSRWRAGITKARERNALWRGGRYGRSCEQVLAAGGAW